jgi:hypothetical protein
MIATTLAFVRTETGTVKLQEGDTVPDTALPEDVERLTAAGVLVEAVESKPPKGRGNQGQG